ncbi:transposase, Mutator family [Finegoldia magna ATCC 53516]|uniref:Mutator family transposase n=9 Tax=Peptoniphilaceae TaxID=1570339 RepID=D6S6D8_FINMA|nr:transposase, Mutator family [Finegoldia magna ATCC 53516]EFH93241.1 transposase, Mutator family [Finegoldia magna ATCC 53516]EFH93267.1 transposase, Mutator family [Finegoldia magna ATCC 53516]EFH93338.1 transposase, Mutator family [Finegoldia magna ATCC 53516]EFH93444.1 transposase, Mutator family [Finegoldia magna ATCC 53516]
MPRKRPETRLNKISKMLIEEYQPETVQDLQEALKDLLGDTMEQMLKAELDEHLDYEYGEKPLSLNTRNGSSKKTVKSSYGNIDLNIPRDREGSFEPQALKKYQKDISNIENQIISMYAKGMTTRDISTHIKEIYGFGISESMVSKITNKILPTIEEWQNRPLEKVYPFVFLDAIHYHVRENNIVVKKAVYIALGYNTEGYKEILGMWVGENESSKYWLLVLNQLKERGLEDILIVSTDNLSGFSQAIESVYPKTEIQKCIIHQIRNSTKFVSYRDIKELMKDLKTVYKASTEELALSNLDIFEEKWGKKYPMCVNSWRNNWAELSTYFKYPEGIRKLIYTTNSIENFNRQLRKVTKNKTIFPSDYALQKSLYLAMVDASSKWTSRIRGWDQILSQLSIFFEGRI